MRRLLILSFTALGACASAPNPGEGTSATTVRVGDGTGGGVPGKLTVTSSTTAKVETLTYPFDKVWLALPVAYDTLGIPIADFDSKTHKLGNAGFKTRRRLGKTPLTRYLDCGQTQIDQNAESYEIVLSVISIVRPGPGDGQTTVSTTVEATGRPLAFAGATVRCTSKGTLEDAIMNGLKWQLGK